MEDSEKAVSSFTCYILKLYDNTDTHLLGCGSDIIQKDLKFDKERVAEYFDKNAPALKPFSARDFPEKGKILLPNWVYGFVLRSRKWSE